MCHSGHWIQEQWPSNWTDVCVKAVQCKYNFLKKELKCKLQDGGWVGDLVLLRKLYWNFLVVHLKSYVFWVSKHGELNHMISRTLLNYFPVWVLFTVDIYTEDIF